MVRDALKLVELKAKEKNVKLIMEADDGIPTDIYSDPSRLRQILLNFMSNSVKFSKNDSTLTVEMKMEEVEGQKSIKFAVCDKVIGIPYESIGKVFLPFQQADNSTTREYGGTGLGLPICVYLSTILQTTRSIARLSAVSWTHWACNSSLRRPVVKPWTRSRRRLTSDWCSWIVSWRITCISINTKNSPAFPTAF
eukprot:903512_1